MKGLKLISKIIIYLKQRMQMDWRVLIWHAHDQDKNNLNSMKSSF
jgi:hypothetical protein